MQRYRNLSGESGVTAFEIRARGVVVEFQDGDKYEYTVESAGREAVETLKQLAVSGRGLSSYISRHVRNRYARKLH